MKEKSLIISTLCVITLTSLLYTNVTCHPNVQAIYLTHACISFFFHETEKEGQFFIRTKIGSLVHNIFRRSRAPAPFLQCANLTSIFCNLSQFRGSFHTLEQTVALVITQLPASPVGLYPFWGSAMHSEFNDNFFFKKFVAKSHNVTICRSLTTGETGVTPVAPTLFLSW